MKTEIMKRLLTFNQTCELLQVSRTTVYRLLEEGKLKKVTVGESPRFRQSEIEALINGGAVNA
jgi:excisionase family DNA binding protein